jgi:hypothetical protein
MLYQIRAWKALLSLSDGSMNRSLANAPSNALYVEVVHVGTQPLLLLPKQMLDLHDWA